MSNGVVAFLTITHFIVFWANLFRYRKKIIFKSPSFFNLFFSTCYFFTKTAEVYPILEIVDNNPTENSRSITIISAALRKCFLFDSFVCCDNKFMYIYNSVSTNNNKVRVDVISISAIYVFLKKFE